MSIQRPRLVFHDNFTIMSNNWARDGRLSLRARGLLVQLLSHRPGWEVSTASLVRDNPEGRDAIRKAIRELEKFGYLKRTQLRDGTEFSGMEYVLQEPPQEGCGFPVDGFPVDGNPDVGESTPKEDYSSEDHLQEELPTLATPDRFEEFWAVYPRKKEKKRAQAAWRSAVKREPAEGIIAAAKNYAEERKNVKDGEQFTKHASTWLNNDCWEDYRTSTVKASPVFWADAL